MLENNDDNNDNDDNDDNDNDHIVKHTFPRKIKTNRSLNTNSTIISNQCNNKFNNKYNNKYKTKQKFKNNNGMTGKIKVFDQALCDKYDKKSRVIIKQILGDYVDDNPDKYGEDMIVISDEIPYGFIELQVYGRWVEDKFPYDSPFIYERKLRFRDTTLFICFNANYDKLIMFARESVHPKKYRIKKYSKEFIYYVPWHKALTIKTNALNVNIMRNYSGLYDDVSNSDNNDNSDNGNNSNNSNDSVNC